MAKEGKSPDISQADCVAYKREKKFGPIPPPFPAICVANLGSMSSAIMLAVVFHKCVAISSQRARKLSDIDLGRRVARQQRPETVRPNAVRVGIGPSRLIDGQARVTGSQVDQRSRGMAVL